MTPSFTSFLFGQAEVFLGRDVAEHRAAIPADHRRADAAGDVVVAGRDEHFHFGKILTSGRNLCNPTLLERWMKQMPRA